MNNSEVIQDFRRRWEGTFVWLHMEEKDKECLVKIREVEESASKSGVLHLDSAEYGAITINMGSEGHSIKFKYPPVGVFQFKKDAVVFRRKPTRQYRRGICSDNSVLENTTRRICGQHVGWDIKAIEAAFDHKIYTVKEALAVLETGKVRSVALDNNYSLALSMFKAPDHVLFHWQLPVARVSSAGRVTNIYEAAYMDQLTKIFNRA